MMNSEPCNVLYKNMLLLATTLTLHIQTDMSEQTVLIQTKLLLADLPREMCLNFMAG